MLREIYDCVHTVGVMLVLPLSTYTLAGLALLRAIAHGRSGGSVLVHRLFDLVCNCLTFMYIV